MSNLQEQGFRFVRRGSEFKWVHPLEVMRGDVDCSDMSDDEFDAFMADELAQGGVHPVIAQAIAPWAPPSRTPEEEARFVAADLADARSKNSLDYEQRRADRIQRRDADTLRLMTASCMPGERL